METPEIDKHFQQLIDFVFETNGNLFLTGKAGTGKTTALRYINEHCTKQLVIAAPTGVAAINAGGTTIHSLFQFPFYAYLPNNPKKLLETLKYNEKRLKLMRDLELLIIDEVSMVRADLLDAIDVTLRSVRRRRDEPFGGVQVLLIGDMFQLPPVVKNEDWMFLKQFYDSPYFFDSQVFKEYKPIYLELTKVYRQSDQTFIDVLNKVRNNQLDDETVGLLNARYCETITQEELEKTITLTTHNHKADTINHKAMENLKAKVFKFNASVKGNFPEKIFPVNEVLELKEGARVMFVKNDQDKRYFNGLIGVISELKHDAIFVKCPDQTFPIEVKKEIWENVSYTHNKKTNQIEEEKLGEYEQYPLRLAWAITIHKSQGLTFDEVVIDAQEAFSAGQVYVALSRCRSLEGLKLKSKIAPQSLRNDQKIVGFAQSKPEDNEVQVLFKDSRKRYLEQMILSTFDFSFFMYESRDLEASAFKHVNHLDAKDIEFFKELSNGFGVLQQTAAKFAQQLNRLFTTSNSIEQDSDLQERISKAANYFGLELSKLAARLENHGVSTESKTASDDISPVLQDMWLQALSKNNLIQACFKGFSLNEFINKKLSLNLPSKKLSIYASKPSVASSKKVEHQALLEQLFAVRQEILEETNLPIFMIASKDTIEEMAVYLPQTKEDLLKIKGFGKAKVDAYGDRFLTLIKDYCVDHNLGTAMLDLEPTTKKKTAKEPKINTKALSFDLFKELKDIDLVAKERNLSRGTIEGHLAHYIEMGDLPIEAVIPKEKHETLRNILLQKTEEQTYKETLELLPEGYFYNEIRIMQAYMAAELEREK